MAPGMFPFPSNGKADPKDCGSRGNDVEAVLPVVSIPFKRESLSKVSPVWWKQCFQSFPFPSNGKAYPKPVNLTPLKEVDSCFYSLQTGKRIQSKGDALKVEGDY